MSRPEAARATGLRLAARIAAALPACAPEPALVGARGALSLRSLATRRFIAAPDAAVRDHNLLVRTRSPLAAAAALASLDGVAARLVLCPPDLDPAQLSSAVAAAEVDAVVCDDEADAVRGLPSHALRLDEAGAGPAYSGPAHPTVWALFTSGTSGAPKLAAHSLEALTGAMAARPAGEPPPVWATFYDIRRYGGLQMLLRALTGGSSLLITEADEALADFLDRLRAHGATHVAGTPSHWRRALMSPALRSLEPRYIRLSGEIADQPLLDALRVQFPAARIAHAYASTEAGVGFEVGDGLSGFPASLVDDPAPGAVQLRVVDGALHVRSDRAALGYVGSVAQAVADADGWVDTGDLVERRGERFHFLGRRSGVINVGGLKISPEEVEAVINACPGVRMSRVVGRPSPLLGALVSAEVVLADAAPIAEARGAILAHCRAALPRHKTPASLHFVDALAVGAAGKLDRRLA